MNEMLLILVFALVLVFLGLGSIVILLQNRQWGTPLEAAKALKSRGISQAQKGNALEAIGTLRRGLGLLKSSTDRLSDVRRVRAEILVEIGRALESLGNEKEADTEYEIAGRDVRLPADIIDRMALRRAKLQSVDISSLAIYNLHLVQVETLDEAKDPVLRFLASRNFNNETMDAGSLKRLEAIGSTLIRRGAQSEWVLTLLARTQQKLDRPEDARETLKSHVEVLTPNLLKYLAGLCEQAGDATCAIDAYRRILMLDSRQSDAAFRLAEMLIARVPLDSRMAGNPEYDEAIGHAVASCSVDPSHADRQGILAEWLLYSGRLNDALEHALAAVKLSPASADYRRTLGLLLIKTNDAESACAELSESCRLAPGSVESWQLLGQSQSLLGRHRDAAVAFLKVLSINPQNPEAGNGAATALFAVEDWNSIVTSLAPLASHLNSESLMRLGIACSRTGRLDDAIGLLKLWVTDQPNDHTGRFELAHVYGRKKEWVKALELYHIAGDKSSTEETSYTAYALTRLGRHEEAVAKATAALSIDQDHPVALYALAASSASLGLKEAAETAWRHLASSHPDLPQSHFGLASVSHSSDRYAEAASHYERGLALMPTWIPGVVALANCYLKLGNMPKVVELLSPLETKGHSHPGWQAPLATAYAATGRLGQADALLAAMEDQATLDEVLSANLFVIRFELAASAFRAGEYELAIANWLRCASTRPDSREVALNLLEARLRLVESLVARQTETDLVAAETVIAALDESAPDSLRLQYIRGLIALRNGSYELALGSMNRAATSIQSSNEWFHVALARYACDDVDGARRALASASNDDTWQSRYLRAWLSWQQGSSSGGFTHVCAALAALQIDPSTAIQQTDLAGLLDLLISTSIATHSWEEGLKQAQRAARRYSLSAPIRKTLGLLASLSGDADQAVEHLENSAEDPLLRRVLRSARIELLRSRARRADWIGAWGLLLDSPESDFSGAQNRSLIAAIAVRATRDFGKQKRYSEQYQSLLAATIYSDFDSGLLRQAAVCALDLASANEAQTESRLAAWRHAVCLWAALLSSPAFWPEFDPGPDGGNGREHEATLSGRVVDRLASTITDVLPATRSVDDIAELYGVLQYEMDTARLVAAVVARKQKESPRICPGAGLLGFLSDLESIQRLQETIKKSRAPEAAKLRSYLEPDRGFFRYLLDTDRPAVAVKKLSEQVATKRDPALLAEAYARLAVISATKDNDMGKAFEYFERAAQFGADLSESSNLIVSCAVELTKRTNHGIVSGLDEAIDVLDRAITMCGSHPTLLENHAALLVEKGTAAAASGDDVTAESILRRATAAYPSDATRHPLSVFLAAMSMKFALEGNRARAVNTMVESIRLESGSVRTDETMAAHKRINEQLWSRGRWILNGREDVEDAIDATLWILGEALWHLDDRETREFLSWAHICRAKLDLRMGRSVQAESHTLEAIRLNPTRQKLRRAYYSTFNR